MDIKLAEIVLTAVVGIVGSATTYFVTRNTNKKELDVINRQSLSEDERAFRTELRDEIRGYREEIESLRTEINQLRLTNAELTIDNKQLMIQIEELRIQLSKFANANHMQENHGV